MSPLDVDGAIHARFLLVDLPGQVLAFASNSLGNGSTKLLELLPKDLLVSCRKGQLRTSASRNYAIKGSR